MIGKAYYMTTLGDWQRHAARFANSHFIVLDATTNDGVIPNQAAPFADCGEGSAVAFRDGNQKQIPRTPSRAPEDQGESKTARDFARDDTPGDVATKTDTKRILVLIEADEGVHLSLEDDAAFHPLPHPLAQKPISAAAQAALAPHGVAPGATIFDAAEAVARVHPLLRHRVF